MEGVRLGSSSHAFIVNRQGLYQTHARSEGALLGPSGLEMPEDFEGVRVWEGVVRQGRDVMLAATWLKGGQWLLVCHQDMADAFGSLSGARRVAVAITLVTFLLLVATTTPCYARNFWWRASPPPTARRAS